MMETKLLGGMLKSSGGKKMKKRKELDALIGRIHGESRRKSPGRGGASHQDQCLSEYSSEEELFSLAHPERKLDSGTHKENTIAFPALLRFCTIFLIITCILSSITVTFLLNDVYKRTTSLRNQLDEVSAVHDMMPQRIQKLKHIENLLYYISETKSENELKIANERLLKFYDQISRIQRYLSNDEISITLNMVPNEQDLIKSAIEHFKTDITEMQSSLIDTVGQQFKINKQIKILFENILSFNHSMLDLKNFTASSYQRGKVNLIKSITEAIHPEIQAFNTSMFYQLKWLSYGIGNVQKTIIELAEGLEHMKREIMKESYGIKSRDIEVNKLQSYMKNRDDSIETIQILKSKIIELLESLKNK